MNESDESLEWTSGWMKYVPYGLKHVVFFIACAITAPIGVVCLLGLCFYAGISNFVSEISFRRKMRRRGRFLARNELGSFIKGKGVGTLIIERPTPGWNFTHAWWAPEKLKEHGVPPVSPECQAYDCSPWDRWVWDTFINPEHGSAYLLRVWNGKKAVRELRHRYPEMEVVRTVSAFVHFSDDLEPIDVPETTRED